MTKRALISVYDKSGLEEFARGSAADAALVGRNGLRVNGQNLKGWPALAPLIESRVQRLATSVRGQVIHGDLCYANILYDRLTNFKAPQ